MAAEIVFWLTFSGAEQAVPEHSFHTRALHLSHSRCIAFVNKDSVLLWWCYSACYLTLTLCCNGKDWVCMRIRENQSGLLIWFELYPEDFFLSERALDFELFSMTGDITVILNNWTFCVLNCTACGPVWSEIRISSFLTVAVGKAYIKPWHCLIMMLKLLSMFF